MHKSYLKLINPNFFCEPTAKSHNLSFNNLINPTIGRSHRSKDKKKLIKFVKDKSKEILALTIEWSYERVHNNYA